jgi:beta-galactosidase GanA
MQTFYHGLNTSTRETLNAATGGAFLSLNLADATALVEKIAFDQSWNEERVQPRKRGEGMHQLKEIDMLAVKIDAVIKRLDDQATGKKETNIWGGSTGTVVQENFLH